ncbi:MAG: hypothetical protein K6E62_10820 [Lachnospiraceae bacterium]|nr:hypothetical protein [Lachnospiraceae bacterium]
MLREGNTESEELIRMAENETKGMDFTFIVDQLLGKELTREQKCAKEAFDSALSASKKKKRK